MTRTYPKANRPVQFTILHVVMVGLFLSTEIHKFFDTTSLRHEVLLNLVPQFSCVTHEIAQKHLLIAGGKIDHVHWFGGRQLMLTLFAQLLTRLILLGGSKANFQLVSLVGRGSEYGTVMPFFCNFQAASKGCWGEDEGIALRKACKANKKCSRGELLMVWVGHWARGHQSKMNCKLRI